MRVGFGFEKENVVIGCDLGHLLSLRLNVQAFARRLGETVWAVDSKEVERHARSSEVFVPCTVSAFMPSRPFSWVRDA